MIISHKNKFIFIKTKKTAGTSIEISLSRFCGSQDVITPISAVDEKIREKFSIRPQNYHVTNKYSMLKNKFKQNKKIERFWNHMPGTAIKNEIGKKIWESSFKFCFERNPWDKTVSMYWWDQQYDWSKGLTFDAWFELIKKNKIPYFNYPLYSNNKEEVCVDFIGKYENMKNDLQYVCNKIGINFDGWLPKAKGNFRKDKRHYSTYFNNNQIKFVEEYFKKEINLLNYSYNSIAN